MTKELIFSVTKKDFDIQAFRAGGKGGQNQNKTNSGCRIMHKESGAVAESRDTRSFHENQRSAFRKLIESPKFKLWHKIEVAKRMKDYVSIDAKVDLAMKPENIKVEVHDENGKWVESDLTND